MTIYDLKPRFQALLRPLVRAFAKAGITANAVTAFTCVLSVGLGIALCYRQELFYLLPPFLFVRMALNAIDGMLARDHDQKSVLGMYLNETCDVVSDIALILPFAMVPPFAGWGVVAFALAASLVEFAGVLGVPAGIGRNYAGPFGKSDRALALGVVAVLVAWGISLPAWLAWLFPAFALASLVTVVNRIRAGISGT